MHSAKSTKGKMKHWSLDVELVIFVIAIPCPNAHGAMSIQQVNHRRSVNYADLYQFDKLQSSKGKI